MNNSERVALTKEVTDQLIADAQDYATRVTGTTVMDEMAMPAVWVNLFQTHALTAATVYTAVTNADSRKDELFEGIADAIRANTEGAPAAAEEDALQRAVSRHPL